MCWSPNAKHNCCWAGCRSLQIAMMGSLYVKTHLDLPCLSSYVYLTFNEIAGNGTGATATMMLQGSWESSQPWAAYSSQVNYHWLFALHVPACLLLHPAKIVVWYSVCVSACVCVWDSGHWHSMSNCWGEDSHCSPSVNMKRSMIQCESKLMRMVFEWWPFKVSTVPETLTAGEYLRVPRRWISEAVERRHH